jgi:hypothetical protein
VYFGGGEGEHIIAKYKLGWVAKSGNYEDLNNIIFNLKKEDLSSELRRKIKATAFKYFDFENQLQLLVKII